MFISRSDAPTCKECGSVMVPKGKCYECVNCGTKCECQEPVPAPPPWVPRHKYDIPPTPKVVVREVVVPEPRRTTVPAHLCGVTCYALGCEATKKLRTRGEILRDLWAISGVHDAWTAGWRTWGGWR